ncbi:MAG TPA: hypothetical protein VHC96_05260, partial [Puia sp.]|nr:hypothetical protein [Puia sp.]
YDKFNTHAADLYRLSPKVDNGGSSSVWNNTSAPIAVFAKKEVPEVANACRMEDNWGITYFERDGEKFVEWHNKYVDPSFFSMFTYPLIPPGLSGVVKRSACARSSAPAGQPSSCSS